MMTLHIPDIRAIRLFVQFVIPYASFITNFTNVRMTRILTCYFLASPNQPGNLVGTIAQNKSDHVKSAITWIS